MTTFVATPGTDGRPHYLQPPGRPEEATTPLLTAGWMRDLTQHKYTWYAPDEQAIVVSLPSDALDDGGTNWLLAAHRTNDDTGLWHATAHPHTPAHIIRALIPC
ncbi:DUF317 domain-containing protein [Streptomyces sp. NPDC001339]|uniref:DUF317 domain-containing protein n=1 Tax=Streptomyces sp. NPDC001339 TaxID=3364563 RepID=UPI00368769EB